MKILALEFSTDHRGVAVVADDQPGATREVGEVQRDGRATHTAAMIDAVLRQAGLARAEMEAIAVGVGPGSYTGIRVAIAFAEGWRLAFPVPLIGVRSVDCLAAQAAAAGFTGPLLAAVDAQRGEYYVAGYTVSDSGFREVSPLRLVDAAALNKEIAAGAVVVGPDLAGRIPGAREDLPSAITVARLARTQPCPDPGTGLEPVYLRPVSFVKAPPPRWPG